jgi:hypothetical protein
MFAAGSKKEYSAWDRAFTVMRMNDVRACLMIIMTHLSLLSRAKYIDGR